jgi:eukaryotic-like serine/threonine-protein kinase
VRRPEDQDRTTLATPVPGVTPPALPLRTSAPDADDRDGITRRGTIRRAMLIGVWVWPSFTLLDIYMCVVLYPGAPLPFFLAYRVIVEAMLVWVYRQSLGVRVANERLALWQNGTFFLAALGVALMALHLGGPRSAYMHGISIVCLVRAAVVPEPWRRSIVTFGVFALVFPVVMALAMAVSAEARNSWLDLQTLAVFSANYVFVVSSAIIGMASGHLVWAAQQQLYRARRLGRYRLQAPIGKGGMGEVWLAWDDALRRNVALKILRTDGAPDAESVRRFEREASSAGRLRAPHTIQVFDVGASDDGVYYLAMEYLPGMDLRRMVDQYGALPPARAIHFIRQACESLEEAHALGIIHRDVKPQNLFVTRVGNAEDFVKLLDFGIAQLRTGDDSVDLTRAGLVRGTPAVLAPELWQGAKADARTDIYALGATLYFLVTGVPPFQHSHPGDLMRAHLGEPPAPPSSHCSGGAFPPALDAIVLRCLSKNPQDRYQSAKHLRLALDEVRVIKAWTDADAREFWRMVPDRPRENDGPTGLEPIVRRIPPG